MKGEAKRVWKQYGSRCFFKANTMIIWDTYRLCSFARLMRIGFVLFPTPNNNKELQFLGLLGWELMRLESKLNVLNILCASQVQGIFSLPYPKVTVTLEQSLVYIFMCPNDRLQDMKKLRSAHKRHRHYNSKPCK